MSSYYNKTPRSIVRRRAGRGQYDRETVHAILDEALVSHVGICTDGQPFVIPVLHAREGETIYLHGSPLSRLLKNLAAGVPICLTVTLIDGLVLARSAFHHSVNYRSVVVLGQGRAIADPQAKHHALEVLVDHMVPGRSGDARGPNAKELKATEVVALEIREASAKVRTGPPVDDEEDHVLPVWAGELPIGLAAGAPVPDVRNAQPLPAYVASYRRPGDSSAAAA